MLSVSVLASDSAEDESFVLQGVIEKVDLSTKIDGIECQTMTLLGQKTEILFKCFHQATVDQWLTWMKKRSIQLGNTKDMSKVKERLIAYVRVKKIKIKGKEYLIPQKDKMYDGSGRMIPFIHSASYKCDGKFRGGKHAYPFNIDTGKKDGRFGYADTMWFGCIILDIINVDEYGKIIFEPAKNHFKKAFEYEK